MFICLFSSQIPFFNMCTLFFFCVRSIIIALIHSPRAPVSSLYVMQKLSPTITKIPYTSSANPKQKRNCVYIVHRALFQAPTSSGGFPAWALVHPACGGPDRPVRIRIIVYLCVRIRISGMIIIQFCALASSSS